MDLEALSEQLSPEFARAVEALRPIREREEDYWRYSARLEALRVQLTMENALAKSQAEQVLTLAKLQKVMVVMAEQERAFAEQQRAFAEQQRILEAERQEKARANEALAEKERILEAERQDKARANQALEAQRQEIATLQAMLKAMGRR